MTTTPRTATTLSADTDPLERIATDLWQTSTDRPFPGLTTHAYLWTPDGRDHVLFYSVATDRDLDAIGQLGGVTHQYLSHRDEAGPMLRRIAERFGSELHAPAAELDDVAAHHRPDHVFSTRGGDELGIEVVPTPGHSPGSTCFVVPGAEGRYLFTGDTLYVGADGEWTAGYLGGISDAASLLSSLDVLAELRPDLVVSSAFAGDEGAHRIDPDEWRGLVQGARRRLERSTGS